MQVILKERLENLGDAGEVVDVKPRYAREYLIPRGLARAVPARDEHDNLYLSTVAADLEIARQAFRHDKEIARTLGVDPAQLSRWVRGQVPSRENWLAVRTLATAVTELLERFEPSVIPGWFASPSLEGGLTPADLLRQGHRAELLAHAEAAARSAFG